MEWLNDDERRTWMAFLGVLEALPAAIDVQLKRDSGLNAFEYMVLAALSDSPQRTLPMTVLAEFACGSISRLSHAVNRLTERGWVNRERVSCDRRLINVTLTDEGMAALTTAAPGHVREVRRVLFDVVSTEKIRQLGEISRDVLAVVSPTLIALVDEDFASTTALAPSRDGGNKVPRA